jgi:hypothetical protein
MDKTFKVEKKSFELSKNDLLSRVIAVLKPEGTNAEVSTKVADLELVYMLDLTDLDCGKAPVTEALVEMLFEQFDFEQFDFTAKMLLRAIAFWNMKAKNFEIVPLDEMVLKVFGISDSSTETIGAYVLYSEDIDTPALLLDKEIDHRIREIKQFKGGYYVIPSSTHEVIIVPNSIDVEYLSDALCEINGNREVMDEEDILSNHIYTAKDGRLEIVI